MDRYLLGGPMQFKTLALASVFVAASAAAQGTDPPPDPSWRIASLIDAAPTLDAADRLFSLSALAAGRDAFSLTLTALPAWPPVSGVPEPRTFALLLAGLAAVGLMARWRRVD